MAQELLTTFQNEIGELALIPGTGGIFEVRIDGERTWSREREGRFPEIKELKQLIRDRIAPGKEATPTAHDRVDLPHQASTACRPIDAKPFAFHWMRHCPADSAAKAPFTAARSNASGSNLPPTDSRSSACSRGRGLRKAASNLS